MFVRVVEIREEPKLMYVLAGPAIRATVDAKERLKLTDCVGVGSTNIVQVLYPLGLPVLGLVHDWKLRSVGGLEIGPAVVDDESVEKMVEGRSQVV
jgi:hypothetical protein